MPNMFILRFAFRYDSMMVGSKHASLMCECITYYIYAYQLRCPKQDVLRTSKLLPKVVICINIIRYIRQVYRACFDPNTVAVI